MDKQFNSAPVFSIREIFKRSFLFYRDYLLFFIALGFLANCLDIILLNTGSFFLIGDYGYILTFVKSAFIHSVSAVTIISIYNRMNGKEATLKEIVRLLNWRLLKYFLLGSVTSYLVMVGGMLFVLPGIYLFVVLGFASMFLLLEDRGIIESLKASFIFVRGHFRKVFFIGAIFFGGYYLISYASRFAPNIFLTNKIIQALVFPLFHITTFVTFIKLKQVKNEGFVYHENSVMNKKGLREVIILGVIVLLIHFSFGYFLSTIISKAVSPGGNNNYAQSKAAVKARASLNYAAPDIIHMDIEPQTIEEAPFIIYVPSQIDLDLKYPLAVALSPNADAQSMVNALSHAAEQNKWIIYASKTFRNNIAYDDMLPDINSNLNWVFSNFPIDESMVVAAGFSGGGMGAHAYSFFYPDIISAVISNTGKIDDFFKYENNLEKYPQGKLAVFLASPTDFRYEEMDQDFLLLEEQGWGVKWLEFDGGHQIAPPDSWDRAFEWIDLNFINETGELIEPFDEAVDVEQDGMVKDLDEEGNLISETTYNNGKRNGPHKTYYKNGVLWSVGYYQDGKKHGEFKVYNPDSTIQSIANYSLGRYDGPLKRYESDGRLEYDYIYSDGEQVTKRLYHENGKIKREYGMKDDVSNGRDRIYDEGGNLLWDMNNKNGKYDGLLINYNPQKGERWEMQYKDGKRHGSSIQFDKDGNQIGRYDYVDGKEVKDPGVELQSIGSSLKNLFMK